MGGMIESPKYKEEIDKMKSDIHVLRMAKELGAHTKDLVHDDGTPRWEFMTKTFEEYRKRSGKAPVMLGSVARAILDIKRGL